MTKPNSAWCKICGVRDVSTAEAVAGAGADAIGMVFYAPSPRYIAPRLAGDICRSVQCQRVGLFVNAKVDEIAAVLRQCDLDLLQFQGDETPEFCSQFDLPYVKGVRMRPGIDLRAMTASHANAWAFLLDAFVAGTPGGTGTTFDWDLWPVDDAARWILAGGLTPANVAAAITRLRPYGVDVSGGVEAAKGIKDLSQVSAFIQEVRRAA